MSRRLMAMGVAITAVPDEQMTAFVHQALTEAGFIAERREHCVRIEGAGVGVGDHSVDVEIQTVLIEGVRIVLLSSLLRTESATFDAVSLACARGNGACAISKFSVAEFPAGDDHSLFRIKASLALYADHLSEEEFARMTWLFVKETDDIDNELAEIMAGTTSSPRARTVPKR